MARPTPEQYRCLQRPRGFRFGMLVVKIDVQLHPDRVQSQLKVARVWGFSETNNAVTATDVYFQVLNSSGQYFNFDSNTGRFAGLDVQEAA